MSDNEIVRIARQANGLAKQQEQAPNYIPRNDPGDRSFQQRGMQALRC